MEAGRALRQQGRELRLQILGLAEEWASAIPAATLANWQREGLADYLGSTGDVRPFIAAADCVVLPTYYREGVPHILLEAAAMARPIITTDMPGCRDAVEQGVSGLLCDPRSARSLAEAMDRFLDLDLKERAAMGKAGRTLMQRQFDQRLVHAAYLNALSAAGIK